METFPPFIIYITIKQIKELVYMYKLRKMWIENSKDGIKRDIDKAVKK